MDTDAQLFKYKKHLSYILGLTCVHIACCADVCFSTFVNSAKTIPAADPGNLLSYNMTAQWSSLSMTRRLSMEKL